MSVDELIKELQNAVESGKLSKDSEVFFIYVSITGEVISIEQVANVLVSKKTNSDTQQSVFFASEKRKD